MDTRSEYQIWQDEIAGKRSSASNLALASAIGAILLLCVLGTVLTLVWR